MSCLTYHILGVKSDEASRRSKAKIKKILMVPDNGIDFNEEMVYWEYYPQSLLSILSAWFLVYATLF